MHTVAVHLLMMILRHSTLHFHVNAYRAWTFHKRWPLLPYKRCPFLPPYSRSEIPPPHPNTTTSAMADPPDKPAIQADANEGKQLATDKDRDRYVPLRRSHRVLRIEAHK
jgi:hypothetical protein